VLDVLDDPALPFFVEWACPPEDHPAAGGAEMPAIAQVEICGNPDRVAEWLGTPLEPHDVDVQWVQDEDPGVLAVHFTTADGTVRID
jgi:hypothetical protein